MVQQVKNPPAMQETQETQVRSLDWEDPLEKEVASTPVFLPGKCHGRRSLVGCSPVGSEKPDTTEWLSTRLNTKLDLSSVYPVNHLWQNVLVGSVTGSTLWQDWSLFLELYRLLFWEVFFFFLQIVVKHINKHEVYYHFFLRAQFGALSAFVLLSSLCHHLLPELFHLPSWSETVPIKHPRLILPLPAPSSHHSAFCLYESDYSRELVEVESWRACF